MRKANNIRLAVVVFLVFFVPFFLVAQTTPKGDSLSNPAENAGPDLEAIQRFMKSASVKISSKNLKGAILDYDEVLLLDPDFVQAYIERGGTKFLMQDLDGALTDYNRCIELTSGLIKKHNKQAKIKRVLEDNNGATVELQIANELKPKLSEAYFRRGNVKIFLDDEQGGCEDLMESMNQGYPLAIKSLKDMCSYEEKLEKKQDQKPPAKKTETKQVAPPKTESDTLK